MSQNKKPALFLSIILGALILLPLLVWFVFNLFNSDGGSNSVPLSFSAPADTEHNHADFNLRQLSEEAAILMDGAIAAAGRSGDLPLESIIALKRDQDRALTAMTAGKSEKAKMLFRELIQQAKNSLNLLEAAKTAREKLDTTYTRLDQLIALKSLFTNSYGEAIAAYDMAQRAYTEGDPVQCIDHLQQTNILLDNLEELSLEHLKTRLEEASQAMDKYDFNSARRAYDQALQYAPDEQEAIEGQALIKSLDPVLVQFEELAALESAGQIDKARILLDQMLTECPNNSFLSSRRNILIEAQAERDFRARVAEADASESADDLEAAVLFLEAALSIKEDADQSARLEKLRQSIRQARLEVLLSEGYASLQSGRFEAARDVYRKATELDPQSAEARTGYEKSSGLYLASIRYLQNLDNAEKFIESGRYPMAAKFFNDAMATRPSKLTDAMVQKEGRLRETIERESKEVRLKILSDGKSYISITGVLAPEKLKSRELNLYPDVYTIKATRSGYKTIEQSIRVVSTMSNREIVIKCTESD